MASLHTASCAAKSLSKMKSLPLMGLSSFFEIHTEKIRKLLVEDILHSDEQRQVERVFGANPGQKIRLILNWYPDDERMLRDVVIAETRHDRVLDGSVEDFPKFRAQPRRSAREEALQDVSPNGKETSFV